MQSGTVEPTTSNLGGDRLSLALTIAHIAAAVFAGPRNDAGGIQAQLFAITAAVGVSMDITLVAKRFIAATVTVLPRGNGFAIVRCRTDFIAGNAGLASSLLPGKHVQKL